MNKLKNGQAGGIIHGYGSCHALICAIRWRPPKPASVDNGMPEFHKFSPRRLFVLLPVLAFVAVSGYGAAAAAQDSSAGAGLYGILGHGAPKVTSADGRFSIKPAGRLLVDFASVEDDEGFEDTNDAAFRAARVGIEGVVWRDFAYKVEVDFSGFPLEKGHDVCDWDRLGLYRQKFLSWKCSAPLIEGDNDLVYPQMFVKRV